MALWHRSLAPTLCWSAAATIGMFVLRWQGRLAMADDATDCAPRSVAILMAIAVVAVSAYWLLARWL